ncbi:MAG: hypothetical protein Q7U42_05105 [Parvibaculum sp.]|nr:hypothetical protein [Parvibaculum sp.]
MSPKTNDSADAEVEKKRADTKTVAIVEAAPTQRAKRAAGSFVTGVIPVDTIILLVPPAWMDFCGIAPEHSADWEVAAGSAGTGHELVRDADLSRDRGGSCDGSVFYEGLL